MDDKLAELKRRLDHIADLQGAAAVLGWDQATYMPPGGARTRGKQMGTLSRLAHEAFVDPAVGRLLDELESELDTLPPDSDDARLIRVTRYDFDRATRVPADFLVELQSHSAEGYQLWARARPANDFSLVSDHLDRTVELSRRFSGYFPGYDHVADPLIDMSDRGMTVARLRPLFMELRERLIPLVDTVVAQQAELDSAMSGDGGGGQRSPIFGTFDETTQLRLGMEILRAFGFDFEHGRQDKSHHPFATSLGPGDVRITTRVKEDDLSEALFSSLHESGHAMYEQNVAAELHGTPLGSGTSSGVHESQSRLWENMVGRSREFWSHYYPRLQESFPSHFASVSEEEFYRAVNRVSRSLIRTDADELTYNLHVMIRFDLECELLEGTLTVSELPEAWRARYQSDLGVSSDTDSDGVLQDMHWYAGLVGGAFQGYTIGNILSAQFYHSALAAHPSIPSEMANGRFDTLHGWLRENIWRHGRKFTPDELLERATGGGMTIDPYLRYLGHKYGELVGTN